MDEISLFSLGVESLEPKTVFLSICTEYVSVFAPLNCMLYYEYTI